MTLQWIKNSSHFVPHEPVVIDSGESISLELDNSAEDDFNKGNQLASDQPDINHADIGGGGELLHHTDEESRGHQHHGEVHSNHGLEIDRPKEGGGVADTQEEEGGQVGGQQLLHQPPLELHLHLYTLVFIHYKNWVRTA